MTRGGDIRLDLDPDEAATGLGLLLVALMELVRELLERQAIRRIDADELDAEQIERVGTALRDIRWQLEALRAALADGSAQRPQRRDST